MNPAWHNSAQFYREKTNSTENRAAQIISLKAKWKSWADKACWVSKTSFCSLEISLLTIKWKLELDLQHTTNEHEEIISEYWAADERAKKAVADVSHLPTFLPFTLVAGNLKVYIPLFLSSADLKAHC